MFASDYGRLSRAGVYFFATTTGGRALSPTPSPDARFERRYFFATTIVLIVALTPSTTSTTTM